MQPESNTYNDVAPVPTRSAAAIDLLRRQLTLRLGKRDALAAFGAAKARHSDALSPYAAPIEAVDHVVGLTAGRDNEQVKVANAVLRAMVLEYQSTTLDTWSACLVLTAGPAMRRFAFLARSRRLEPDELVQRMVESLLLVARRHPSASEETYLPVYLKREMSRHAFDQLDRGRKDRVRTAAAVDEALARRRLEPFADAREEASRDPVDEILERQARKDALFTLGPMGVQTLLARAPSLKMLTRLTCSDLTPREQNRIYQQMKRWYARCRALGAQPDELPPGWLLLGRDRRKTEE